MASNAELVGQFIEQAPPGELNDVLNDIKSLTSSDASLLRAQDAALKKYNQEQFTTVKLPGSSQESIVSPYNVLEDGRYFDAESQTSFEFDHASRRATGAQSHTLDSKHADLIKSITKAYRTHASEHFPSFSVGVYPYQHDEIALVLVANKYSPNNFWNGRWRSSYVYSPSTGDLKGSVKVDVHYYEDGNVRMLTDKDLKLSAGSSTAAEVVRQIASAEKKYQEDLNRAFTSLSEGAFKGLRRQLPVTRQKIEWDKIGGYRLGQDIGGGARSR